MFFDVLAPFHILFAESKTLCMRTSLVSRAYCYQRQMYSFTNWSADYTYLFPTHRMLFFLFFWYKEVLNKRSFTHFCWYNLLICLALQWIFAMNITAFRLNIKGTHTHENCLIRSNKATINIFTIKRKRALIHCWCIKLPHLNYEWCLVSGRILVVKMKCVRV